MSTTWTNILNDLNRDVARDQPKDVIQWGADWFQGKLRQERQNSKPSSTGRKGAPGSLGFSAPGVASDLGPHALSPFSEQGPADSPFGAGGPRRATVPTGSNPQQQHQPIFSPSFGSPGPGTDNSPFSESASSFPPSSGAPTFNSSPFGAINNTINEEAHDEPPIPSYALGRRTSVSAESLDEATPNPNSNNNAIPSFPKTEEQLQRIRQAIKPNFLFRNLDEEQETDVLAAMKETTISAGEMIIEQGAAGDYFYIVESGELDIFVKKDGQVIDPEKGDRPLLGKKVATCKEGSSFGELALMHNAPRAASILSITPCTLWALDRVSFRTILLDHTSRKRRLYESFLSEVQILQSLQPQERAKIADVLESRTFNQGEDVIKQGEAGDEFFLIESGNAIAIKRGEDGRESVVKRYNKGDYFGELALLNKQTRAATIRADGSGPLRVAFLGEQAFTRLLGPVKDIMARSVNEIYGFSTR
uniref:cAMP-dependent protein kinase regulatory subunit n=1 Tax=Kwoniella pini CBS 10737 TaxID=1296096 RepID=A0A1B9I5Y9_9TREE|nr:cAMP-dependent protein kinase regulator [Kwoniella pini CBS 10737]OCF50936.1 cAMP-dependent protein kinase regulator [Kwoniella pini CBS 10737]